MQLTREEERRRLRAKAELLWLLVTTTPGVGDLAEPMKRVERHFDRLSKGQRTTIAVIAQQFAKGCHDIDAEGKPEEVKAESVQAEIVQPDEVIPPGGEKETDGSGTGD
jgi:hypothetical protein